MIEHRRRKIQYEKKVKIRKNIGRIFRQHNIIEYKSPEDHLNIDDFYKVYGYTCIYKTEVEKVNQIPAEELTITFVCYHYPRQMLRNLQNERNINVKNIEMVSIISMEMQFQYSLLSYRNCQSKIITG